MKKKNTTFLIGLFSVGSLILLVGLLYFLGNTTLFSSGNRYVMYFNESVNGLNVGSPVKLRGVPIGSVQQILVDTNLEDSLHLIPVVVEILPERLKGIDGERLDWSDPKEMEKQIGYGLRGRLQQLSLITGQIYIELDYIRKDDRFSEPQFHHYGTKEITELPTIPSALAELSEVLAAVRNNLKKINFKEMGDSIASLLKNANENLEGDRIGQAFGEAANVMREVRTVLAKKEIQDFINDLAPTLEAYRSAGQKIDAQIEPMGQDMKTFLKNLDTTLAKLDKVIDHMGQITQPESEVRVNMVDALQSMSQAATTLSRLLDYLERNPDALVKGRPD